MKNDAPTNEVVLDTEYLSFMAELGDGKGKDRDEQGGPTAGAGGD